MLFITEQKSSPHDFILTIFSSLAGVRLPEESCQADILHAHILRRTAGFLSEYAGVWQA